MKTASRHRCDYCIDGMIPAGSHDDLGPVYQRCPFCLYLHGTLRPCTDCHDTAVFPADYTCLHCLLGALADLGLTAALCPGCTGVTYVVALPDREEVGALPDDEEEPE